MTKHTSGPWKVCKGVIKGEVVIKTAPDEETCLAIICDIDEGETKANAHLVKASPDLLIACKSVVTGMEDAIQELAKLMKSNESLHHKFITYGTIMSSLIDSMMLIEPAIALTEPEDKELKE